MKKRRGVSGSSRLAPIPQRTRNGWATRPETRFLFFSRRCGAVAAGPDRKADDGGAFLGRIAGKAVFVPLALPGEETRIRIVVGKRGYSTAEVEEIVMASSQRVLPACPYFGACGGCQYQHATYAAQLAYKQEILRETLERGGVACAGTIEANGMAEPWAVPHRIRLAFDAHGNGKNTAPFARGHSYCRMSYRGAAAGADGPRGRQNVAEIAGQFARERDFPLLRCGGDSAARECHGCRKGKTRL